MLKTPLKLMNEISADKSASQWARAFTMVARSGHVTNDISDCEEAWASEYLGNPTAAERVLRSPGYQAYAQALRSLLPFPLTVYRILPRAQFETWLGGEKLGILAATASLEIARAFRQVYPAPERERVLLKLLVSEPQAVIMRGRIRGYELVMDFQRISAAEASVVND